MRKRYMGTPEQYNDDLNIITGLVNLRRMWDSIKSKEDPDMISRLGSWRTHQHRGGCRVARTTHTHEKGIASAGAGRLRI